MQYAREGFAIGQPSLLKDKYVVYKTKGIDAYGKTYESNRRYNEFYQLRQLMRQSWPGLYVPFVPGKKIIGNKDVKFIIERRYFLERFFMQMSRYDYLLAGPEYSVFSRPKDGVEIEK